MPRRQPLCHYDESWALPHWETKPVVVVLGVTPRCPGSGREYFER